VTLYYKYFVNLFLFLWDKVLLCSSRWPGWNLRSSCLSLQTVEIIGTTMFSLNFFDFLNFIFILLPSVCFYLILLSYKHRYYFLLVGTLLLWHQNLSISSYSQPFAYQQMVHWHRTSSGITSVICHPLPKEVKQRL
jgi:hypothetical protein